MKPAAVASPAVGSWLVMGSTAGNIIVSTGSTGTSSCPGFWLVSGGSTGAAGGGGGALLGKAVMGASGPATNRAATRAAEIQAEIFIVLPPCHWLFHVTGSLPDSIGNCSPDPVTPLRATI